MIYCLFFSPLPSSLLFSKSFSFVYHFSGKADRINSIRGRAENDLRDAVISPG